MFLLKISREYEMSPRRHDSTLRQTYQQCQEDPDTGFDLDCHDDLTTSQVITSLRALPMTGPDIKILRIGNKLMFDPPSNNIILSANVLRALLLTPLLDFI